MLNYMELYCIFLKIVIASMLPIFTKEMKRIYIYTHTILYQVSLTDKSFF